MAGHEVRLDPVLGAIVHVVGDRQSRPNLPVSGCPFCVGGLEAPDSYDVKSFANRWPAMPGDRCEVVLYTSDHDATFWSLGPHGRDGWWTCGPSGPWRSEHGPTSNTCSPSRTEVQRSVRRSLIRTVRSTPTTTYRVGSLVDWPLVGAPTNDLAVALRGGRRLVGLGAVRPDVPDLPGARAAGGPHRPGLDGRCRSRRSLRHPGGRLGRISIGCTTVPCRTCCG